MRDENQNAVRLGKVIGRVHNGKRFTHWIVEEEANERRHIVDICSDTPWDIDQRVEIRSESTDPKALGKRRFQVRLSDASGWHATVMVPPNALRFPRTPKELVVFGQSAERENQVRQRQLKMKSLSRMAVEQRSHNKSADDRLLMAAHDEYRRRAPDTSRRVMAKELAQELGRNANTMRDHLRKLGLQ